MCFNIGDCRAVLCRNGMAMNLSLDSKPWIEKERDRIIKAGGYIDMNRVNVNFFIKILFFKRENWLLLGFLETLGNFYFLFIKFKHFNI